MKRKCAMFWNNSCQWLKTWYGISAVSERYSGFDFVEANGRVFFKAKLSTIMGSESECITEQMDEKGIFEVDDKFLRATNKDFFIGFVKPTSQKATILDVISADDSITMEHPTISVGKDIVSWIKKQEILDDSVAIEVASASTKYSENYAMSTETVKITIDMLKGRKPVMVMRPYGTSDGDVCIFAADMTRQSQEYALLSVSQDGSAKELCLYDKLFGYNDKNIFLARNNDIIIVDRETKEVSILKQCAGYAFDNLAYVDTARNEFFFYEKEGMKHPGKSAFIGLALSFDKGCEVISKERIECPDVVANADNPLIYDGYKYVWRVNSLWNGYKIYRKDGSLREQFIVEGDKEEAKSPTVFSSPTVIFVEWEKNVEDESDGRCLSYSTNIGLCQMLLLDDSGRGRDVILPEPEDR